MTIWPLAAIAVGASGLVSVLGNVLPRETTNMVAAARRGDRAEAIRLHQQLLPLMDALFLESNPVPLKAALKMLAWARTSCACPSHPHRRPPAPGWPRPYACPRTAPFLE